MSDIEFANRIEWAFQDPRTTRNWLNCFIEKGLLAAPDNAPAGASNREIKFFYNQQARFFTRYVNQLSMKSSPSL
jgi:hypothetical protein